MSLEEAKSELDRLLDQSVREHLMSDVPLGVWLSGGVDSTTMLHYAAEASNSRLRTFSISFNGYSFDESSSIAEIVKQYDTEHEQLDLNPGEDLEGAIRELSYYSDEPSADSGALPVWFLSKLCKTRCTVAFSGEGADEVFGGAAALQGAALPLAHDAPACHRGPEWRRRGRTFWRLSHLPSKPHRSESQARSGRGYSVSVASTERLARL